MNGTGNTRALWIALVSLAVLAAGVGVAARQWGARTRQPKGPAVAVREPAVAPRVATVDERAIEQALELTPGFATEKQRWVDEVGGVDASDLTPPRRARFVAWANAERCTCGCGYTLAGCRAYDATCKVSPPLVTALLDSVRRGLVTRMPPARKKRPTHGG